MRRHFFRTLTVLFVVSLGHAISAVPLRAMQQAGPALVNQCLPSGGGTAPAPSAAVYRLSAECLAELRSALNAGAFGRALAGLASDRRVRPVWRRCGVRW